MTPDVGNRTPEHDHRTSRDGASSGLARRPIDTPSLRIVLTADPELPVPPRLYGGIERIVDLLAQELVR